MLQIAENRGAANWWEVEEDQPLRWPTEDPPEQWEFARIPRASDTLKEEPMDDDGDAALPPDSVQGADDEQDNTDDADPANISLNADLAAVSLDDVPQLDDEGPPPPEDVHGEAEDIELVPQDVDMGGQDLPPSDAPATGVEPLPEVVPGPALPLILPPAGEDELAAPPSTTSTPVSDPAAPPPLVMYADGSSPAPEPSRPVTPVMVDNVEVAHGAPVVIVSQTALVPDEQRTSSSRSSAVVQPTAPAPPPQDPPPLPAGPTSAAQVPPPPPATPPAQVPPPPPAGPIPLSDAPGTDPHDSVSQPRSQVESSQDEEKEIPMGLGSPEEGPK